MAPRARPRRAGPGAGLHSSHGAASVGVVLVAPRLVVTVLDRLDRLRPAMGRPRRGPGGGGGAARRGIMPVEHRLAADAGVGARPSPPIAGGGGVIVAGAERGGAEAGRPYRARAASMSPWAIGAEPRDQRGARDASHAAGSGSEIMGGRTLPPAPGRLDGPPRSRSSSSTIRCSAEARSRRRR